MSRKVQSEAAPEYFTSAPSMAYTPEETEMIDGALAAIYQRLKARPKVTSPSEAGVQLGRYFTLSIGTKQEENFVAMWLDTSHGIIATETMFQGTIDSASVYPRIMVKRALHHNACAVILAHNHPSGSNEPSRSDIALTARLKSALELIDVRVLDHMIIGDRVTSLAELGHL